MWFLTRIKLILFQSAQIFVQILQDLIYNQCSLWSRPNNAMQCNASFCSGSLSCDSIKEPGSQYYYCLGCTGSSSGLLILIVYYFGSAQYWTLDHQGPIQYKPAQQTDAHASDYTSLCANKCTGALEAGWRMPHQSIMWCDKGIFFPHQ